MIPTISPLEIEDSRNALVQSLVRRVHFFGPRASEMAILVLTMVQCIACNERYILNFIYFVTLLFLRYAGGIPMIVEAIGSKGYRCISMETIFKKL
jgi:hypothetical protein